MEPKAHNSNMETTKHAVQRNQKRWKGFELFNSATVGHLLFAMCHCPHRPWAGGIWGSVSPLKAVPRDGWELLPMVEAVTVCPTELRCKES